MSWEKQKNTAAIIGNPNCGKSSIFNQLTGLRQRVGNWPGVTVDKKTGFFKLPSGTQIELVDLPGIHSLEHEHYSIDESIAKHHLENEAIDVIINVVDATCLDRQLLLTHQLRDLGKPVIVVLNMMDLAKARGINIDTEKLSAILGVPVIGISAHNAEDIQKLASRLHYASPCHFATRPESDQTTKRVLHRMREIRQWVAQVSTYSFTGKSLSERIDSIVLHPWYGGLIFLTMMYLLFTFSINVGAVFIDFFDILVKTWFVDGTAALLSAVHAPEWSILIISTGIGGGLQLVASFIPVIGFLYLGLTVLESSGYMVRAAYVVDRIMSAIGLPGKAFVPLIVGFGCNVPSVMAVRTLDSHSDRLITMTMTPFMSCGARLTVYALFASVFFPENGQNVVFLLYLLGILMAVLTAWLLRGTLGQDEISSSIMEMPAYHVPKLRNTLVTTRQRLNSFVMRAGKTIVTVALILSILNSVGTDGSLNNEGTDKSVLSAISQTVTPVFSPLGIDSDNWPATVGIITGIFAKEAVVGTLDTLYSSNTALHTPVEPDLAGATSRALISIWDNARGLAELLLDPLGMGIDQYVDVSSAAKANSVQVETINAMYAHFESSFAAFCYLVMVLLYTPCIATMGALVRESGHRWSMLVISWSTLAAYATATSIYQIGTFFDHPVQTFIWVTFMGVITLLWLMLMRRLAKPVIKNSALIPMKQI